MIGRMVPRVAFNFLFYSVIIPKVQLIQGFLRQRFLTAHVTSRFFTEPDVVYFPWLIIDVTCSDVGYITPDMTLRSLTWTLF